ncbi:MAG: motility protein A [Armatimonadota bacterium]
MNVTTVLGLALALAFILGSVVVEGGHLGALVNLPAAMIVFGGTFGAAVVTARMEDVLNLPRVLHRAFFARLPDPVRVSRQMVEMARLARREGFLELEKEVKRLERSSPFMAKALQMVADGTSPEVVTDVLRTEVAQLARRHRRGADLLMAMGGLAPTLGVTGTVMGLVHMMGKIEEPSAMGPAIASAFLATLYGVASANVIFIPLATKLGAMSRDEQHICEIILEGVRAIQRGDSPILVAEALKSFVPPNLRADLDGDGAAGEEGSGEHPRAA